MRRQRGASSGTGHSSAAVIPGAINFDPVEKGEWPPPQNSRESTLRKEVSRLKRMLADKTLELDFFKGSLQKVEARRQQSDDSGGKASTTKSGK